MTVTIPELICELQIFEIITILGVLVLFLIPSAAQLGTKMPGFSAQIDTF